MNNSSLIAETEAKLAAFAKNIDAARILTVDGEHWYDAQRVADLLRLDETLSEEITWVDLLQRAEVRSVDVGEYSDLIVTEKGLTTLLRHSEHPCALSYITFVGEPLPVCAAPIPDMEAVQQHVWSHTTRAARRQYLLDRAASA